MKPKNKIDKENKNHKNYKDQLENLTQAVWLVDASSFLYRAYFGLPPLTTSKGLPTQAIFGMLRMMKKLVEKFRPLHLAFIWDCAQKTFRSDIYPAYKATRETPPSSLFQQKDKIVEIFSSMEVPQFSKEGFEADDVIAHIVRTLKQSTFVIVGPDKDLYQLLGPSVLIYDPFKEELVTEEIFQATRGFSPLKLSFFHALVGDPSDNIPGVKGIGKVTSQKLVEQFEDLPDLFRKIEEVGQKRVQELLKKGKDDAFLSYELFKLYPMKVKWPLKKKDFQFDPRNWEKAYPHFKELEFSSLLMNPDSTQDKALHNNDNALSSQKEKQSKKAKIILVQTKKDLDRLKKALTTRFALDTETMGFHPLQDAMVGLSVAANEQVAFYIPFLHCHPDEKKLQDQLPCHEVLQELKTYLEDKNLGKILHNAKFDRLVLWQYGIDLQGVEFDTMLAANLFRQEGEKISLKALAQSLSLGPVQDFKDVVGGKLKTFNQVPLNLAADYAGMDALGTFRLLKPLQKKFQENPQLKSIFENLEMPLQEILFKMEKKGVGINLRVLKEVQSEVSAELVKIRTQIHQALPPAPKQNKKKVTEINLNSTRELETLFFDRLQLPVIKKSRTGKRSTDQDVLAKLSKLHPIPGLLLRYRELNKLRSTYLETLPLEVNKNTGRIHTTYGQTLVATGRLSSSRPNLQNIPAGGDFGEKIREAFEAEKGRIFISADYSQIELRVLAYFSQDENLKETFYRNEDIHLNTASKIFEVPPKKVTTEMRQIGKRLNFAVIYGMTPYGLSQDLEIPLAEAKEYIEKFFNRYPNVRLWMETVVAEGKERGYVQTWMGRPRYVPGLREKNRNLYEAARRVAVNGPIQGTAAEIMKKAMIDIDQILIKKKLKADMILQIHDELIFEVNREDSEETLAVVKDRMEHVVDWNVPFLVTLRKGKNWGAVSK